MNRQTSRPDMSGMCQSSTKRSGSAREAFEHRGTVVELQHLVTQRDVPGGDFRFERAVVNHPNDTTLLRIDGEGRRRVMRARDGAQESHASTRNLAPIG